MTPQDLKNSILQLAIQGKLVEQRLEEGTAEELYAQLYVSRKHASKRVVDIPFDIPENWCWVRVAEVSTILYGFPFNSERFNKSTIGRPLIRIRDINEGYSKTYTDEVCDTRYLITRGDMLVGMDGNFQVAFWKSEDAWLNQRVCKITAIPTYLNQSFLYYYLPVILKEINGSVSFSTVKHLSAKILNSMTIPLPPLAEQKRIVERIEQLLPLIDRYGEAWSQLETFNARFPDDMQKAILQAAIQGKLVEQRPEEGTAEDLYAQIQAEKQALIKAKKIKKDKPLPEITDEEKSFDIPESWKWVHWGDIVNVVSARRVHQSDWTNQGVPFYRAREIAVLAKDGHVDNDLFITRELYEKFSQSGVPHVGDLMVTAVGTLGKTYIVRQGDCFYYKDASVICLENFGHVLPQYLKCLMQSEMMSQQIKKNSSGTTVGTLTISRMNEYVLPLPPLAEQKRIVAKIEELLALCRRLKA